jgi:hypothetical protein
MSDTTTTAQEWEVFDLPEEYSSRIPEELRGLEWVRVLGYAVASRRASAQALNGAWWNFYESSAPNGLMTSSFSQYEGWQQLENTSNLDHLTRLWASDWMTRFQSNMTQSYILYTDFNGAERALKFVWLVSSMVAGWALDIHHFEQGSVISCPICGELTDDYSITQDTNRAACEHCLGNSYYWSDEREAYYEYSENRPEEEHNTAEQAHRHPISGYNKSTERRLGKSETATFYGFELEIENEDGDSVSDALDLLNAKEYCAHEDGSLHDGIEIVSYPMSADYIRENLNLNWLRDWSRRGWRSWDSENDTCGLHIHVSRAGFANDVHLFAFAQLIYSNEQQFTTLAGRRSSYGSFQYDKRPPLALDVKKRARFSDRYVAVNLTNDHTAEVRIFKGSLNEVRVRSALELISGAVEFTRPLTIRDLNAGALKWARFVEFLKASPNYYRNTLQLIESKGL